MSPTGLIFSLDIGGTRTKAGLIDLSQRTILAQSIQPTCTEGFEAFLCATENQLEQLCILAGIERSAVSACGIGLPGYVDGIWVSTLWHTIAFLEGHHFLPELERCLKVPVKADNDARVVALGEAHFGGHEPVKRLLSLTLGSGLGFGLVVDGRLQEPTSINHLAGHIPIRPVKERCFCGFCGCLEMLVNSSGLLRNYEQARLKIDDPVQLVAQDQTCLTAEAVFEAARLNDPVAQRALEQWLTDLSMGLNAYIHLFGPDLIVFGGGLSKGLSPWLGTLQARLFATPYLGYQVRLAVSQIQEQAGILGAAVLCLD